MCGGWTRAIKRLRNVGQAAIRALTVACLLSAPAFGDEEGGEEREAPPPALERYIAAAVKRAERQIDAAIAAFAKAPSGAEKRIARVKVRELVARSQLPHPVLDVRGPAVGDVGILGEPHRVLEVRPEEVRVLRATYRRGASRPSEVHFFLLSGVETEELAEGAVAEFPQVWVLTGTYDGARPDGRDTFLAEPIDALLAEHADLLDQARDELQARYARWD